MPGRRVIAVMAVGVIGLLAPACSDDRSDSPGPSADELEGVPTEDPGGEPIDATTGAPGPDVDVSSAEDPGIRGILKDLHETRERDDDTVVPGGRVTVLSIDGSERIGESVSDAEGEWYVPVPEPGRYLVRLDPDTLPSGVESARLELEVEVNPNQVRVVLFSLGSRAGGG